MSGEPYEACKGFNCQYAVNGECRFHKDRPKIACVDLDNTLLYLDEWQGHNHFGEVIENTVTMLRQLKEKDWKIILYTTRDKNLCDIKGKLKEIGIWKYIDHINRNPYQPPEISQKKLFADVYFDDRAYNITPDTDIDDAIEFAENKAMGD